MLAQEPLHAGYISALCFLLAFIVSYGLDRFVGPFDQSKSRQRLFIEAVLQFWLIGMIIFYSGIFIDRMSWKHNTPIPMMVFIFMFFQKNLQTKVNYLIGHF